MKAPEQCFPVVLFIILYKVAPNNFQFLSLCLNSSVATEILT